MNNLTVDEYKILILEKLNDGNIHNPYNLGIKELSNDLGYNICVELSKSYFVILTKTTVSIKKGGIDYLEQIELGKELVNQIRDIGLDGGLNIAKRKNIIDNESNPVWRFIKNLTISEWGIIVTLISIIVAILIAIHQNQ
jgi:hypothetical protein